MSLLLEMKRLFAPERARSIEDKAVTPVSALFPEYASTQWQGVNGAKVWIPGSMDSRKWTEVVRLSPVEIAQLTLGHGCLARESRGLP